MMLREPVMPSELEIAHAQTSLKLLRRDKSDSHFVIGSKGSLKVPITESAFNLLLNVLTEMSRGNALLVVPINAEVTTQEAADLLSVSRPYFVKLLDDGKIAYHMVGSHRRILFKDLMAYRAEARKQQFKAMQELTEMDDELGIALSE